MTRFIHRKYAFRAMGSPCTLQLFVESQIQGDMLASLAMSEIERIEAKYSRYDPMSVLSEINRLAGNGETVAVDAETAALIEYAFACFQKSGRLFDITSGVLRQAWKFPLDRLPENDFVDKLLNMVGMDKLIWRPPNLSFSVPRMEIDFGGIGKEYAVDRVAELLMAEGVEHGLIECGGDLFALGPQPDGTHWNIGLRDPHHSKHLLGELPLEQGALTTSGDYERCAVINGRRYNHLLNPMTGWPVCGLSSVTVIAPKCMVAGAATTIAMLKQFEGIPWLSLLGLPHIWIDEHGRLDGANVVFHPTGDHCRRNTNRLD